MSQAELRRLEVIKQVIEKKLKQREGGEKLGVSARQIKRMVRAYRQEGAEALVSKRRGCGVAAEPIRGFWGRRWQTRSWQRCMN